jgi:hypothetical protein
LEIKNRKNSENNSDHACGKCKNAEISSFKISFRDELIAEITGIAFLHNNGRAHKTCMP